MAHGSGKRWRQALVWLHVVTSVGWMAQALALASLAGLAVGADAGTATAAMTMARHLDLTLLAPLANASAFTGFVLAAATAWGYFRHWWVLVKFGVTLGQLYIGIFVLSDVLDAAVVHAARGGTPDWRLPVGAALMASAIGFQAWLSIAKPFGRTPWSARPNPPTAPRWVFALAVVAAVGDLGLAWWLGHPLPACGVLALAVVLARRAVLAAPAAMGGEPG